MIENGTLRALTTDADNRLWHRLCLLVMMTMDYMSNHREETEKHIFECHAISMAVNLVMPELKLEHGRVWGISPLTKGGRRHLRSCDHSWLRTPDGAIIDCYPPGFLVLDPVLIPVPVGDGPYTAYAANMYEVDEGSLAHLNWLDIKRRAEVLSSWIQSAKQEAEKPATSVA